MAFDSVEAEFVLSAGSVVGKRYATGVGLVDYKRSSKDVIARRLSEEFEFVKPIEVTEDVEVRLGLRHPVSFRKKSCEEDLP